MASIAHHFVPSTESLAESFVVELSNDSRGFTVVSISSIHGSLKSEAPRSVIKMRLQPRQAGILFDLVEPTPHRILGHNLIHSRGAGSPSRSAAS
jgi:hypothetical protein